MPMVDYQAVPVSTESEIVSEILSFATANGWTVSGNVVGDGADCWAEIQASGTNVTIRGSRDQAMTEDGPEDAMMLGEELLGVTWSPQGTLHLFAHDSPKALYAIHNYSSDAYQWLSLGNLIKSGDYVGGTWYAATSKPAQSNDDVGPPRSNGVTQNRPGALLIGCDSAGFAGGRANGSWCYIDTGDPNEQPGWCSSNQTDSSFGSPIPWPKHFSHWYRGNHLGAYTLINRGPNQWNGQTVLNPLNVFIKREEGWTSHAGRAPGIRICRLDNYNREDEVTVGEQTYKVFPWFQRADGANGSRYWGFAMELPE